MKGGVITLATPQGELAVLVSAATKIQSAPGQGGPLSLSSIEEGMHVTAVGELQADGSLVARLLILRRLEVQGVIGPNGPATPGP